jgi:predicted metalloendopeptidase
MKGSKSKILRRTKKNRSIRPSNNRSTKYKVQYYKKTKKTNCKINLKPFQANLTKFNQANINLSSEKIKSDYARNMLKQYTPSSIKPTDNFYDYINYEWLKNFNVTEEQKYIVQVDEFRLAQDRVYRELDGILQDYMKSHKDKLSKNLSKFYNSIIKMNPKPYSRKLSLDAVQVIENFTAQESPWKLLAYFNKDEMINSFAPFSWQIVIDEKDTRFYRSFVGSHTFFMLDLSLYYDDGFDVQYKKTYRKNFLKYCKSLFDTLLGKHSFNPQDVFDVEVELYNAFDCSDNPLSGKVEPTYNKIMADEAMSKYGFNWAELTSHLGFDKPPEYFLTNSTSYLKCCTELMMKSWKTPKWKTYWTFILLQRIARLTTGWEDILYQFYGKFEKGQSVIIKDNAVSAALYMSLPFNKFLVDNYVSRYQDELKIQYVSTICDELKIVFKRILERNKWLEPSTKKYALKKLEAFKFVFGKDEAIVEDPDIDYNDNLYDNMIALMAWRSNFFVKLESKSNIAYTIMDWTVYPVKMVGNQPYIVNASYTPTRNSIFINLGFIQKPFVDLDERGIEYNLASIGYTLGHEMSHGFDDTGSRYGIDGRLEDWWTAKDKSKYKLIQDDVIKQYHEFAKRDGIEFDASISIGEDLADISALSICDEFLQTFQINNNDFKQISKLSFEAFYTYYAIHQKQKISKKAINSQLKTNPHPLDKYRCNVPLSRSVVFRSLFHVKQGDGMWWHNTNTVW